MRLCFFIVSAAFLSFAFAASAQVCGEDCIEQPSCTKLGYKLKSNIYCENGYITCPFDSSYIWCKEYTCEDGRYYSSPLSASSGYICDTVEYHGLTCYDCEMADDCSNYSLSSPMDYALNSTCKSVNGLKYAVQSCRESYHWDGSGCVVNNENCPDYPLTTCPANASCSQTTCDGKTVRRFYACRAGYHLSNNACVANDCSDYPLTACPANTDCDDLRCVNTTYHNIVGCDKGYHLSNGSCVINDCSDYPLTDCPTTAKCSSRVCGDQEKHRIYSCKSGYHWDGENCVVNIGNCPDYTLSRCPSNAVCSSCDGKFRIDGCEEGYVIKDNACVEA